MRRIGLRVGKRRKLHPDLNAKQVFLVEILGKKNLLRHVMMIMVCCRKCKTYSMINMNSREEDDRGSNKRYKVKEVKTQGNVSVAKFKDLIHFLNVIEHQSLPGGKDQSQAVA